MSTRPWRRGTQCWSAASTRTCQVTLNALDSHPLQLLDTQLAEYFSNQMVQAVHRPTYCVPAQLGCWSISCNDVEIHVNDRAADDEVPRGHSDPERSHCALTAQIQLILLTPQDPTVMYTSALLLTALAPVDYVQRQTAPPCKQL
jgi:hypothetical protein